MINKGAPKIGKQFVIYNTIETPASACEHNFHIKRTGAMDDMEALPPGEMGSMLAIVTGDGTWLTRGHFSKNHTYTIRNYMYVVHVCMRGEDI